MLRTLLVCGLLAGLGGGLVAAGVAGLIGEPAVGEAIAYENAQAAGESDGPELVSRDVQSTVGLLTATVAFGVALGGLFALVFAAAYGRTVRAGPARTSLWLAAGAFVVVHLVPFAKYPANPPGVGDPDTLTRRTTLFLVMIAISLLAAVAAARLRQFLASSFAPGVATVLSSGAYLILVVAAGLALPGVHEVPVGFPPEVLWDFREASMATQAALWATVGLIFAAAAERVMTGRAVWSRSTAQPSPDRLPVG